MSVFLDASIQSDECMRKWFKRREDEVKKMNRGGEGLSLRKHGIQNKEDWFKAKATGSLFARSSGFGKINAYTLTRKP